MRNAHAKHATDLRMTIIGWLTLLLVTTLALGGCNRYNGCPSHSGRNFKVGYGVHILKWHTDSRGLTSVQWRDNNGKEWGLDYATRDELNAEGLVK